MDRASNKNNMLNFSRQARRSFSSLPGATASIAEGLAPKVSINTKAAPWTIAEAASDIWHVLTKSAHASKSRIEIDALEELWNVSLNHFAKSNIAFGA